MRHLEVDCAALAVRPTDADFESLGSEGALVEAARALAAAAADPTHPDHAQSRHWHCSVCLALQLKPSARALVKIEALRVAAFRRFADPAAIEDFGDGINVLSGPNEMGKSTFFHALEAAFTVRHKVSGTVLDAMRPFARRRTAGRSGLHNFRHTLADPQAIRTRQCCRSD